MTCLARSISQPLLERASAMPTIPAPETIQYLPPVLTPSGNPVYVALRFPRGNLFCKMPVMEAVRVLRHGLAMGVVSNGGKFHFMQLAVSLHRYHRVMNQCKLPPMGPRHVSTHYQRKGAQEWVQRFDKAKTGRMGAVRTVFAGGRGQN